MFSTTLSDQFFYEKLFALLSAATKSIYFTAFHVHLDTKSSNSIVNFIFEAIIKKNREGLVILPIFAIHNLSPYLLKHNRFAISYLQAQRVPCYVYKPYRLLHTKLFIIDDNTALFGSHNLTKKSLQSSAELSFLTQDPAVLSQVKKIFFELLANSERRW